MDALTIRTATIADLQAINDIHNYYIINCTCIWRTEPYTLEERQTWFRNHGENLPVIVAEIHGQVAGFGSLSMLREICGWAHTVENSVYVHPEMHGRGIGKALLAELIARAQRLTYTSIVAVISSDQSTSLALHAKTGFIEIGRIKQAGFKFTRWFDGVLMQRMLRLL